MYQNNEYKSRINRVLDYIELHIREELKLEHLASIACFSPFHFHRIFSAMMGETVNQFIQRIRLEKAVAMLIQIPEKTITEIAFDCGFSGSPAFARSFQNYFGTSASTFRKNGLLPNRKICKEISNIGKKESNSRQVSTFQVKYIYDENNNLKWRINMETQETKLTANVEMQTLPDMTLAYVRNIGPFAGDAALFNSLFCKLCKWAGPRGLIGREGAKFMTVYHDDTDLTEKEKLRISVGLIVPENTEVSGEVGKMKLAGGLYATAFFIIDPEQYKDAWAAVYGGWLPESGYQPDDKPCFELYEAAPEDHPEGKHTIRICVPVKPM